MSARTKSVCVLVPGPLYPRALERIERDFTAVRIDNFDVPLSANVAAEIRGIGAMLGVSAKIMDAFPNLEIIAHSGVGYDSIDVGHAASRGIMVTNTPGVLSEEVADTALGLLLNAVRELPQAENWLRNGKWNCGATYPLTKLTLRGRRAGIFGLGRVGQAIARRLQAFGIPVEYHSRRPVPGSPYKYHATLIGMAQTVDTLISTAPSTSETRAAVNGAVLHALGPEGVFVNVGRGATVDQEALIAALQNRTIAAAGLDVFVGEPHLPKALLDLPNATLVPHIGSASEFTRGKIGDLCVDNLVSWFAEGRPLTAVPETAHVARAQK